MFKALAIAAALLLPMSANADERSIIPSTDDAVVIFMAAEEIQMEQQQAMGQQMAQQATPQIASAAGKMAQEDPEKLQAMAGAVQQGMQAQQ